MSPPTELSFDEILKFMLAHNGKVTNHELVKHFKVFLMNPDMRDQARSTFKKHVNSLAIIKNQNNEKWLILKKKYMVNSGKESDEQTETKIEDPPAPECSEPSPDPPVQPPYRPPPLLQLNQDFNILNNIIQVSTPITSPLTPVELTQSDSKESLESEDVPPKVHPRRRSSEKSATPTVQSHNLNPRSSIPNSTTELNETPLTTSRSESMLVESEQKISVKERKQMFNRMASESDVLKSQKLSFNSSSVDEEDRASLDHKENDPLDPKQKQWILCAARGEYHALAKMCKENAKLVRTKNNMPFKIIECIEKGQKRLCIVPSLWETNGELRWPRKRLEVNKLVKDENSRPLDNWSTSKCCVKRSSISSYEEAMRELDVMVQNSDTEIDTVTETNARDNTNIDFNALAGQFIVNQPSTSSTATTSTQILPEVITDAQYVFQYIDESELATMSTDPHRNNFEDQIRLKTQKNTEVNQIENYLKLENQHNMAQTINVLVNNQKKILHTLASLSVQIDDGFSKAGQTENTDVVLLGESNPVYSEAFKIKPIDSVKELEQMDTLLSDKNQKFKLLKQYSFICSPSDGKGATCAYKVLDMFFTREFLCKCSWTGGSRKSDEVKIGLKGYQKVLNFFYELIHHWDKTYTLENNENFFKIVLKNSVKRKLSNNIRASTKRMRTKKTDPKNKAKTNSEQGNQHANQTQMDTNNTKQNENDKNFSNQREMDANEDGMIDENAVNLKEVIEDEEEEDCLC